MRVLTFGIQLAEVAVDVGTGEVVVEKVVAIHDVGRVINPLGARSQIEGGIIQALGHTFSEARLDDPQTGTILTRTFDSYKVPTIADVPEIVCDLVDEPDQHLTNLGSKGLGEPPIVPTAAAIANAIRDATGADVTSLPITREEILRALRDAEARGKEPRCSWNGQLAAEAVARWRRRARPRRRHRGRAAPARRARRRGTLVDVPGAVPRGISGARSEQGPRWPSSKPIRRSRRRSGRRAGWPPRRSSATWARSAATCSRPPGAGTGASSSRATSTAVTSATRQGQHREHAFLGNERCASAHPSDPAAALLALGARVRTDRRELDLAELYRLPTDDDRATTTLEPGELILELDVPEVDSSVYLKAMDRKRWAFALVGVAAARVGG